MKKIAIFQTDLNLGGIQKSLLNLLNNIDYNKYSIDLYLFSKNNIYIDEVTDKVNIKYLKKLPSFVKFVPFKLLNKFYKNVITEDYDITIDYNSYSMDTALAAINVKGSKKIIWVHNDIQIKLKEEYKYRILYSFFKGKYKYFDSYVNVSIGALSSFREKNNYSDKEYVVIPNIIDTTEIIEKSNIECSYEVDSSVYNICSVGRLIHQKGFDILLSSYKDVLKTRKDIHLYIIGDGPLKSELKKYIDNNCLEDYVTLVGFLKNPYSLMNEMDGFILTSRYEGQGMVFLEAKCLGLDVILPKHLEKYVAGLSGSDNIIEDLLKLEKHDKKIDLLESYNNDILDKINDLLK